MSLNWPTKIHQRGALPSVRVHLPYMAPRMTPVENIDSKTLILYLSHKNAMADLEKQKKAAATADARAQVENKIKALIKSDEPLLAFVEPNKELYRSYALYEGYKAGLELLEKEKTEAQEKEAKVQVEHKAAIDSPSRWGRQEAKDALVKRVSEDLSRASALVQKAKDKIEAFEKINKTLVAYIDSHKDLVAFYENHLKTQAEYSRKIKEALEAYDARVSKDC